MKRMRIIHKTGYFYNQPVKFGPHRAMMRPREGHDAHIARAWVEVEPKAEVSWLRDTYDNSIEHIHVGVSREQEKASPFSGSWEGPSDAFERMTVLVQVVEAT